MADFLDKLRKTFKQADVLMQFIYINIGVFIFARLFLLVCTLFNLNSGELLGYLEMPSSFSLFIRRPWTIFTYMFLHYDLIHILFNMLWLYWFGRIFLSFFNGRQLGGLYVLGGIGGGLLYLLSFNLFPYFESFPRPSFMLGASASVLAIVVAPAIVAPNYSIRLFIFGNVKLKYIVLITILLDIYFLSSTPENAGGHIAHLGGALIGMLFSWRLSKGKDITLFINKGIDIFWNLFSKKPKMKVRFNNTKTKKEATSDTHTASTANDNLKEEELNRILDKLKKSGYESLSTEEKKNLFHASKSK
ncbi:MAG: rhomboid family intramembrane serine protease [Candidatus Azobacteroides sp.]|nr:rhomboid family intramembrane serine protease [Candidatus Azobacteroides sp.]